MGIPGQAMPWLTASGLIKRAVFRRLRPRLGIRAPRSADAAPLPAPDAVRQAMAGAIAEHEGESPPGGTADWPADGRVRVRQLTTTNEVSLAERILLAKTDGGPSIPSAIRSKCLVNSAPAHASGDRLCQT